MDMRALREELDELRALMRQRELDELRSEVRAFKEFLAVTSMLDSMFPAETREFYRRALCGGKR